jgi:WD40 repeat protein/PKD repeat protein
LLSALILSFILVSVAAQSYAALGDEKLTFVRDTVQGKEIYVMNVDGSDVARLTENNTDDLDVAWSPDGRKIAFASNRDGNYEIYVINIDGTNHVRLTSDKAADVQPAWSPDGSKIAFVSDRDGIHTIYIMNADGGSEKRILHNPASEQQPSWSPDGKRIAFAGDRGDGSREIYAVDVDGSNLARLTYSESANDLDPSWSPDGSKIAFVSDEGEIYVMDADGANLTRLTNNPYEDGEHTWSPDGQKIAFVSDRDGNPEIYVMNADGSAQTRITDTEISESQPSWSPVLERSIIPPVITVPEYVPKKALTAEGVVVYFTATATDNRDHDVSVKCTPPSGSKFQIGDTTVTCTAVDSDGNHATASFVVSVVLSEEDVSPPVITVPPSPMIVNTASSSGTVVNYSASATDKYGAVPIDCTPPSGSVFRLGGTVVSCTATDVAGNTATASFLVMVRTGPDIIKPTLVVPPPLTVKTTSQSGEQVKYSVSVTDNFNDPIQLTCTPPSGSVFAVGDTTVTCTATDLAGNVATNSFVVSVVYESGAVEEIVEPPDEQIDEPVADVQVEQPVSTVTGAPTAEITVDGPTEVQVGTEVFFSAELSRDDEGIVEYSWFFEDDGATSNEMQVTHRFDKAGSFNVQLTVTDNDGQQGRKDLTISVTSPSAIDASAEENIPFGVTLSKSFTEDLILPIIGVAVAIAAAVAVYVIRQRKKPEEYRTF